MDEDVELIILDEDDDMDEYRNARPGRRTNSRGRGGRSNRGGRSSRRGRSGRGRVQGGGRDRNTGDIVRRDTGGLSTGKLVEAGAQILAAIQPLPSAPVATGKLEADMANLVLYQKALAEHAKRDEQLRTVGSLASKLFA